MALAAWRACDLCGAADAELLLASERLDGPLVRCRGCGHVYVGRRERDFTFSTADPARSGALADRVADLGLVDHEVEDAEGPWRAKLHERRLDRIRRHAPPGRLLDVGCSSGEFLEAAIGAGFDAEGVEPDPITSRRARHERGLAVRTATLEDARFPAESFDVATLWHTIEHLDSPRRAVEELHRVLAPGGLLAVETPTIDNAWFRLAKRSWRQLIPDHYHLFGDATLRRLLAGAGFETLELGRVGKPMSLRFVADRVRRANAPLGRAASRAVRTLGVEERTVTLGVGDVMLALARRR